MRPIARIGNVQCGSSVGPFAFGSVADDGARFLRKPDIGPLLSSVSKVLQETPDRVDKCGLRSQAEWFAFA